MTLILVWGDDWEGLYADGELVLEGHSIVAEDVIEFFWDRKELVSFFTTYEVDYEWLREEGRLPQRLEDAKLMKDKIVIEIAKSE